MPFESQLALIYWANLKGHNENHPPHTVLQPSQGKQNKQLKSFGWII